MISHHAVLFVTLLVLSCITWLMIQNPWNPQMNLNRASDQHLHANIVAHETVKVLPDSVVPITEKHYEFAIERIVPFFTSCISPLQNAHIMLVFSTFAEEDIFLHQMPSIKFGIKNCTRNVFTSAMEADIPASTPIRSIVTIKKWWALYHVRKTKRYEYYITMDAEAMFVRPIDQYFLAHLRSVDSFVGVTPVDDLKDITQQSKLFISDRIGKEKADALFAKNLYTWWMDVPWYDERTLDHFFDEFLRFSTNPEWIATIDWNNFDHLTYTYYMVHYHKYGLVGINGDKNSGGLGLDWRRERSHENLEDPTHLTRMVFFNHRPVWAHHRLYKNIVEHAEHRDLLPFIYIVYHIDGHP